MLISLYYSNIRIFRRIFGAQNSAANSVIGDGLAVYSLELSYPRNFIPCNFRTLETSRTHFVSRRGTPTCAQRDYLQFSTLFSFAISAIINQFVGYSYWNLVSFRGSSIRGNRQSSLTDIRQLVLELSCSQTHSQTHRHAYI